MASDKQSRTEEPTEKRKAEARKKGQVAKSQDLVAWVSIALGITALQTTFGNASNSLLQMMSQMELLIAKPDIAEAQQFMASAAGVVIKVVAPLALAFAALAIVGNVIQTKFVLASQALKPNWKKLNVFEGLKRIVSKNSLVEATKQLLKLVVLVGVAYQMLYTNYINAVTNGPYDLYMILSTTAKAAMDFLRIVAIAGILIGIADFIYQRKKTSTEQRMTKEEVRQEMKQQDVSPELKAQLRAKARAMSRNRMMASINDADAVIVNPVHVAIALKYDPTKGAPKVTAKGAGFVAEKIREKAEECSVPIVQDIPLARTLHNACDIDDEIPGELFEAVAKVLAFVFGLRSRGNATGTHKMPGTPDLEEYEKAEAARRLESGEPEERLRPSKRRKSLLPAEILVN